MIKFPDFGISAPPRLGQILAPKDNSFNFLRLALAALVLVSHSYLYLSGSADGEPLALETGRSLGEYAVQAFFILSGVMVAQSFHRSRSLMDFAAARALRIFPALLVCVALTAFVFGPLLSACLPGDYFADRGVAAYILKTITLSTGLAPLPGVFESNPLSGAVNTSLWTLKYEVICYIALAAAGLAGLFEPRWRTLVSAGLALFVTFVFFAPPADEQSFTFVDSIRYFSVFFGAGVLAYVMRDKLVLHAAYLAPLAALFFTTRYSDASEIGSALFLGYLALWASSKSFGPMRAFSNRMDLSYGVYIYAGPVQQALIHVMPGIAPLALTLFGLTFAVPLAVLSWVIIERPSQRLRPVIVEHASGLMRRSRLAAR